MTLISHLTSFFYIVHQTCLHQTLPFKYWIHLQYTEPALQSSILYLELTLMSVFILSSVRPKESVYKGHQHNRISVKAFQSPKLIKSLILFSRLDLSMQQPHEICLLGKNQKAHTGSLVQHNKSRFQIVICTSYNANHTFF